VDVQVDEAGRKVLACEVDRAGRVGRFRQDFDNAIALDRESSIRHEAFRQDQGRVAEEGAAHDGHGNLHRTPGIDRTIARTASPPGTCRGGWHGVRPRGPLKRWRNSKELAMPFRDLKGLRILVTGASQGIGRALVVEAAKRGCKVLAVARSQQLLDELAAEVRKTGGAIETVVADITKPADRQAMADAAVSKFGGLDVLVNNAGIGATGHFVDTTEETLRSIFETNYFGLTETIRVFLPILKQGRQPSIVNIGSVVGRRALPARCLYSASKFAVAGFSEAIREELAKDGIQVQVVSPGLTQTNFSKNMLEAKAKLSMDHQRGMTSEQVAEATMTAIEKGKTETTLTFKGKMLLLVSKFAPFIVDFFAKKKVKELFADEIAEREKKKLAPASH
jgi:short-subunit dehydrogenase